MATRAFCPFFLQEVLLSFLIISFLEPISCHNFIDNPGFEDGLVYPWTGHSAIPKLRNDVSHTGSFCLEVSYRIRNEQGVSQHVVLEQGHYYRFKAFVKQMHGRHGDNNFKLFETYKASLLYTWTDNGDEELIEIAIRPFVEIKSGWVSLESVHVTPHRQFSLAQLTINGPEADIDFLLDDVSIEKIYDHGDWLKQSTANIEKLRKSTVHMEVQHPPSYLPEDIEIKVDHKRHLFGFGCRVNQDWIVDPKFKEYREIFYKMFNWATLDGFDWSKSTGSENTPDYNTEVRAMDELLRNGIQLRGHTMFSGVPGNAPDWVEKMNGPALKTAIQNRVNYIVNITRGKIHHWDVNNELLHGQFYEEKTRDPNMTEHMFDLVHKADPNAQLFLNDFDVVSNGAGTQAYIDLAKRINSANVGLYGLGAENYFISKDGPNYMWRDNLGNLSSNTGLPIWISQIRLNQFDVYTRMDYLEWLLRLYFGHPAVKGITLWGFWDHDTEMNSSLVNGFEYKANFAGEKYLDLVQKEWSTHVVYNLTAGPIYPIKGYQGDYDVTVYYKGKPIKTDGFLLSTTDMLVKIVIDGTENELTVPTTINPFSYSTHEKHIWHKLPTMIGTMTSRANNSDLQCTTRWSNVSDFGVESEVHVLCEDGEVLTGCSSLHQDYDWHRGGESIELRSGKITCSAKTLPSSTKGVYAIARCCKTFDMTCNYWNSDADTVVRDEEMETDCQPEYRITATFLSGACCRVPTLSCTTVRSGDTILQQGGNTTRGCSRHGYIMTGCNVDSYYGKSAGAFIEKGPDGKDQCVAINGADKSIGERGAEAVAVCCTLDKTRIPLLDVWRTCFTYTEYNMEFSWRHR